MKVMDMQFIKYAATTYTVLSSAITKSNDDNQQILDPITTLLKLGILGFKDFGTKISINSNRIVFQEAVCTQGISRWKKGDTRNHLHNLHNPIIKFMEIDDYNFIEQIDHKYMCKLAINGLNILKKVYNDTKIIKHSIELYINVIDTFKKEEKLIDIESCFKNEDQGYNVFYSKFNKIWSKREISMLCDLLREVDSKFQNESTDILENEYKYYLESLENILHSKDLLIEKIVKKLNSGD